MNINSLLLTSLAAAYSPLTGDVNLFWIVPAGAVCLILVVLLILFGKKRSNNDDDDE